MSGDARCIGVFDSGIGGLTVVRELRRRLPGENIVYFGDTARVPYGIKTSETVTRFARQNCEFLLRFDPKLIVVACNTASATALPELEAMLPVPVCGVVLPGAKEATLQSEGGTIAVIATEATIASDAYRRAIKQYDEHARVIQKPCPLLVPIAEEGRTCTDPIVLSVVRDYLDPIVRLDPRILVLGCTHYPLLREAIAAFLGPDVQIVGSGRETSLAVRRYLEDQAGLCSWGGKGSICCYVSDNPARLRRVGSRFLNENIENVELVTPERYVASAMLQSEVR